MNKQNCTLQGKLCKHYKADICFNCKRAYKDLFEKPDNPMPICPLCKKNDAVGIEKGINAYWCIDCMKRFYVDSDIGIPQEP